MTKITIFILALTVTLQNIFAAPVPELGVNLTSQGAFVNIMNHTNRYKKVSSFDKNGWPESDFEIVIMDHRPVAEWKNEIDDPEEYRIDYSGRYHGSFHGQAEIKTQWSDAYFENISYDSSSNTTYFDLVIPGPPAKGHGFVYAVFSNTRRTRGAELNTGVTDLKIMRPGYDLNTKQIFTDEYINLCRAADFACYRFYNLQNIWMGEPDYPAVTKWENRKTPGDATQEPMGNMNGKLDGWCWEYIIELANILNKDIWVNIHISCDSAYVINLARMLKENLNPGINIYVENSNEVWSPTFKKNGPYNKEQADAYGITFNQNYARRTVELSRLFAQVFGEDAINKRIRVILAGQQAYHKRSDEHLNYINKTFGPPKNYIYATSTGLYFGTTKPGGTIEEINEGMLDAIDVQIHNQENNLYRPNHINKAKEWDLPGGCTSYEGGPAVPANGKLENLDNQILAHRTVAMIDVIKKNYQDSWFDIGGGLAMYFSLFSPYTRYGCWGLTDDFNKPDRNYKMQAVREIIAQWNTAPDDGRPEDKQLLIYPNPANGTFSVAFKNNNLFPVKITLINQLGEEVKSYNSAGTTGNNYVATYKTDDIPSGIYFLKISGKKGCRFRKLIILH